MTNPNYAIHGLIDANSIKSGWRGTNGMQPDSCDIIDGLYKTLETARGEFNDFTRKKTEM